MTNSEKQGNAQPSELDEINAVIDRVVRPFLRADGGDLQVVSYKNNVLAIRYQGACGCCPHAMTGTLMAIENALRKEYNKDITVTAA